MKYYEIEMMSKPQKTQEMSCEWLRIVFFVIEQRLKMSKCGFKNCNGDNNRRVDDIYFAVVVVIMMMMSWQDLFLIDAMTDERRW